MTSKNILFIGAILFLLLVTSSVTYFLDEYNPLIETVTYEQEEQHTLRPPVVIAQETNTPHMLPLEENRTAAIVQEHNMTSALIQPKKTLPEVNQTIPETSKPLLTKIERKIVIIPKREKTKHRVPVKHVKKYKTSSLRKKSAVIIEPVVMTKTLQVSRTGRLNSRTKTLLRTVARKVKTGKGRYIRLATQDITAGKRNYLKELKSYLLHKGVSPGQIEIKITRTTNKKKYVFSDIQKNIIEFSLLERI